MGIERVQRPLHSERTLTKTACSHSTPAEKSDAGVDVHRTHQARLRPRVTRSQAPASPTSNPWFPVHLPCSFTRPSVCGTCGHSNYAEPRVPYCSKYGLATAVLIVVAHSEQQEEAPTVDPQRFRLTRIFFRQCVRRVFPKIRQNSKYLVCDLALRAFRFVQMSFELDSSKYFFQEKKGLAGIDNVIPR
ncbi:hypothetical protein NDU88_006401 [Pleurodeles waltl]|uniref:Uncharacterized protein n=1 Tax=Pleurodeles waltl TaxID=8319 RepID=A0AAV7TY78_PLEWA|nr:hypothetical protein NDU88_006401 [Pleurodeles waltl]